MRSDRHLFSTHDNRNSHLTKMTDLEIHFKMVSEYFNYFVTVIEVLFLTNSFPMHPFSASMFSGGRERLERSFLIELIGNRNSTAAINKPRRV